MSVQAKSDAPRLSPTRTAPDLAAYSGCTALYTTWTFSSFGYVYAVVHLNASWCYDGYNSAINWGPQCYIQTNPGEGSDENWCGWTSGNNQWQLSDSNNFDLWRWITPYFKH